MYQNNTTIPIDPIYQIAPTNPARDNIADIIFFIFIVGGQSYFFGLINPQWLYVPGFFDIRMLLILYCTILTFLMLRNRWVISFFPGGKIIFFVAAYIFMQFLISAIQLGAFNAFKVFRYYCFPLVAIGPLIYILTISKERQVRFIRWVFIATVVQGLFYILHYAGFSIFFTPTDTVQIFSSLEEQRFNHAFPSYTTFVLNASLLFMIYKNRLSYSLWVILLSFTIILYATRSIIIPVVFSLVMITTMAMLKKGGKIVGALALFSLFAISGYMLFIIIFPEYPNFVADRLLEITGAEGLRGAANYRLRILYVENVVADMSSLKDLLIGHGYEAYLTRDLWNIGREATDISMQGDAPIAGLLFVEGFVGVALRTLPFIILLFVHIRLFFLANNSEDIIISTLIIVMISGSALGWLQTTALRDLPLSLLPYFLLHSLHSCGLQKSVTSSREDKYKQVMPASFTYGNQAP